MGAEPEAKVTFELNHFIDVSSSRRKIPDKFNLNALSLAFKSCNLYSQFKTNLFHVVRLFLDDRVLEIECVLRFNVDTRDVIRDCVA